MNFRAILLLSATVSFAIPLRKGDSWTWVVRNRATNDSLFRMATVLDSVVRDSGTVWSVQGRDSASGRMDTALLLARPDGSQSWLHGSRWLPWEPQPWRGATGEFSAGLGANSGLYPYANDTAGLPWGSLVEGSGSFTITANGFPSMRLTGGAGVGNIDLPSGIWEGGVGLVKFLLTGTSPGTLALAGQTQWTLRTHGGNAVASQPDSLAVPDSGEVFVWEELVNLESGDFGSQTTSNTVRQRIWKVRDRPADSAGWTRIRILETMVVEGRADTVDTLDLRLDRTTGARLPARGTGCPSPDDGWWSNWSDSLSSQWRVRHFHWGNQSSDGTTTLISDLAWNEWLVPIRGMDSANCAVSSSTNTDISSSSNNSWITRVMLSANGEELRISTALAPPRAPRSNRVGSLAVLASRYPDAVVRWSDLRGRTGEFPAGGLLRPGPSGGLRILEATFPDGSRWKGPWLGGMVSR